ncbi:MAG: 4-hydroxybenzoate octaprenyltransferase [Enterobacterales bacterium]|nr:4-hydroxybenzoate octaprenyltransferase [Enterobacterales bacterium]
MQKYFNFFTKTSLDKLEAYTRLMRFDRPIGFLLLLWPTLAALWIASEGFPKVHLFIIFSIGVIVMRSAGCVINDLADRKLDGHVARTSNRPLVTGEVTKEEATMLLVCLFVIALILVMFLNLKSFYWAIGGAALTMLYPFSKRLIWFPQVILGVTFAWSVPMAFVGNDTAVTELTWLIYFINLIWIVMYDTLYAMVDRDDDIKVGIKSTAILFGDGDRLLVGIMQAMTAIGIIILGNILGFGWVYFLAAGGVLILFLLQQYWIKDREPAACFRAFLNNNYVGFIWFLGVALGYLQI